MYICWYSKMSDYISVNKKALIDNVLTLSGREYSSTTGV